MLVHIYIFFFIYVEVTIHRAEAFFYHPACEDIAEEDLFGNDLEGQQSLPEIIQDSAEDDFGEWEMVLERPETDTPAIPAASSRFMNLPAGSWATPGEFKDGLAPGCRIQRRIPTRSFQVHVKRGEHAFSKTFTWAKEGSPDADTMFEKALEWSWQQYHAA